jgi:GTP-binding protein EngB required for normal cell division
MGTKKYENQFVMDDIRDKIAILLGQTGSGKSSFINCITNKNECKVGKTTDSCTKDIHQVDIPHNGFVYYFVDTPGLDDGKGDEKNIQELDKVKKSYPRMNVFIICLKLDDNKLSSSLKKMLLTFMGMFPSASFWDHVLILRTHSERSKKFEKKRKNIEGELLKGINKDKELTDFMIQNKINMPTNLKEFFVDSDPEELDDGTKEEFELIFEAIAAVHPLYKDVKEDIKEYTNEYKVGDRPFIHIRTDRIITFTDFDGKEHETTQTIGNEDYSLDGIKPILIEVKREQDNIPRGSLSWGNQFKTHYYLVKYYKINQVNGEKRVQSELEWRWESKDRDGEEIPGEDYRRALNERYNENTCKC